MENDEAKNGSEATSSSPLSKNRGSPKTDRKDAEDADTTTISVIKLQLKSIIGGPPLDFELPNEGANEETAELEKHIEAIYLVDEGSTAIALERSWNYKNADRNNVQAFVEGVKQLNKPIALMARLNRGLTHPMSDHPLWSSNVCGRSLLNDICHRSFNRSVTNAKKLNSHYKIGSSEVYGETSFEQIQLIADELSLKERDIFVDLGSGVGHVIVYIAGMNKVKKAVGIELAKCPAEYAVKLEVEFKKMMQWWGKKYRPFELHNGNILDEKYRKLITEEATVIFINNFAFQANLERNIKSQLLENLQEGTRIVTTKPYATGKEINGRHMDDVEAMLDVVELSTVPSPTSWTDKKVPFYLHTVNRAKMQLYFENQQATKSSKQRQRNSGASSSDALLSEHVAGTSSKPSSDSEDSDDEGVICLTELPPMRHRSTDHKSGECEGNEEDLQPSSRKRSSASKSSPISSAKKRRGRPPKNGKNGTCKGASQKAERVATKNVVVEVERINCPLSIGSKIVEQNLIDLSPNNATSAEKRKVKVTSR